jgi:hypothetical protein
MTLDSWLIGRRIISKFTEWRAYTTVEAAPTSVSLKLTRDFVKAHVRPPRENRAYPHWAIDTEALGGIARGRGRHFRISGAMAVALAEAGYPFVGIDGGELLVQCDLVGLTLPGSLWFRDLTRPGVAFRAGSRAEVAAVLDGLPQGTKPPRLTSDIREDPAAVTLWPPQVMQASIEQVTLESRRKRESPWLPSRRAVAICMSWLDTFARPAAGKRFLDKSVVETWSREYVSRIDIMTAAALLGYELTGDREAKWTWKDRRHVTSYMPAGRAVRQLVREPVDVKAEVALWAERFGRESIVPYKDWWRDAEPEQIDRAIRFHLDD